MREFESTWTATKQAVFDTVVTVTDYVADAEVRRQQSLASLLEAFEAAHNAYAALFPDDGGDYLDPDYVATWKTALYEVNPDPLELAMIEAAQRYIIARDLEINEGIR